MKVLHLNTYSTGGAAKAALRLNKALRQGGIDSEMLILYNTLKGEEGVSDFRDGLSRVNQMKLKVANKLLKEKHARSLKDKPQQPELFSFPDSVWDIIQHPAYGSADVIHLHWVVDFLDYRTFFANCRKPLVRTFHDHEPYTGGFHYALGVDTGAYESLIEKNLAVKRAGLEGTTHHVVCPSAYLSDKSAGSELYTHFPHQVIRNGILPEDHPYIERAAARQLLGLPAENKVVLFLADYLYYARKGLSLFLEAIDHLERDDLTILLVGDLKGEDQPNIENCHYFQSTNREDELNTFYAAADVYVNPSLADISSNTLMEAQAMGTPVAALPTGGIPELAALSESVFIASDKSSEALAEVIQKALGPDTSQKEIRSVAFDVFGMAPLVEEYRKLYASLAGRGN